MQIRRFGIKFQKIDHVLISHLHGDHYFGLVGLLSTMHMMGRVKPVMVYGPTGLKDIVEIQLHAAGSRLAFDVIINELEPNTHGVLFEDNKIKVSWFPLKHKIPTQGFRIDQKPKDRKLLIEKAERDGVKIAHYHRLKKGEDVLSDDGTLFRFEDYTAPAASPMSYGYCSDTCYSEAIVPFIEGVDVLYHEATFTEDLLDRAEGTKHSTAKQAATIAKLANVGKLKMGHLSARYDNGDAHVKEATPIFPASSYVEDGEVISIN